MQKIQFFLFLSISGLFPQLCFCQVENTTPKEIRLANQAKHSVVLDWEFDTESDFTLVLNSVKTQEQAKDVITKLQAGQHSYSFSDLEAGAIYTLDIQGTKDGVSFSKKHTFATESASTGTIDAYFTRTIDESPSLPGTLPGVGWNAVRASILDRINTATESIDVMMYNCNRSEYIDALKAAVLRGVRVRYLTDTETFNSALTNLTFPVFKDLGSGIMHNKVLIIDANASNPNLPYVLTGSLNWTTEALSDQYNNQLVIQDQALARGYSIEFDEMWGGAGLQPNAASAKFGSAKTNNTPEFYTIGGVAVECHFSPSDGTTAAIESVIDSANKQFYFSLLLFTNYSLSDKCIEVAKNGIDIQGIIDDIAVTSSQYQWLADHNVAVQSHSAPEILHHKYGLADPLYPNSDPTVVTGSHNWTFSAETKNDENTLIIHNANLTAQFYRDYVARRMESPVKTVQADLLVNQIFLFPNPTASRISLKNLPSNTISIQCFNALGQAIGFLLGSEMDVNTLPSGTYFLQIRTTDGQINLPFQKI